MKTLLLLFTLIIFLAMLATACVKPGQQYLYSGEPDLAITECTQAIELDPSNAGAYYNRGCAYLELGRKLKSVVYAKVYTEAARIDFEKCIEFSKSPHLTQSAKVMLRETITMIESY